MACLGHHISDELLPQIRKAIDKRILKEYLKRCGIDKLQSSHEIDALLGP